ncbi:MAG: ferrous iron transport protein B [Planctomycetales bacterium]|nr:ferrous iron transport protein B [Planctomycetales bacterium]
MIGNPNTGKSTLFNALSGQNVRTGNYPGVTVEKRIGHSTVAGQAIEWIDLPGTYSLVPRSPDEWIAVDVLVGQNVAHQPPDAVLCVVDASNLERNLFLFTQLLDLGRPVVVALNMMDQAERHGISIDVERLSDRLGVPVIPTEAHRRVGIDPLAEALIRAAQSNERAGVVPFPEELENQCQKLETALAAGTASSSTETGSTSQTPSLPRFLQLRLLLDRGSDSLRHTLDAKYRERVEPLLDSAHEAIDAARIDRASVEAVSRYSWLNERLEGVVSRGDRPVGAQSFQDRVDRFLVHKVWGTLTFVLLMLIVFQAIFAGAEPLTAGIEAGVGWIADIASGVLPEGVLRSLVVDGVIAGVGGVLVFLPQILILFFFIGILEDCGYMARAAFLMDRLMARIGLNGKAFIPLLSSFACAIPGILATRTIENRRDRLITILVAPLMSCSARLPVYTLLSSAFIPSTTWLGGWVGLRGLTVASMYALGIVAAVIVATVLRRTMLKGETSPFLLELPMFKFPSPRTVLGRMVERGGEFVKRAGTLILAVTVLVWAAASFPVNGEAEKAFQTRLDELSVQAEAATVPADQERLAGEIDRLEKTRQSERLRESALGQAGQLIAPVVRPLGWDWKIGCAAIASFPAREVIVGTLGVLYQLGNEEDENSQGLRDAMRKATWDESDQKIFTVPVALSIMVFFSLCAQCASTLVVIRRETGRWSWAAFSFGYMTVLAYVAALLTYQIGTALGG